jgi:hypothetical protein
MDFGMIRTSYRIVHARLHRKTAERGCPVIPQALGFFILPKCQSQSNITTDGQSASVLVSGSHQGLATKFSPYFF